MPERGDLDVRNGGKKCPYVGALGMDSQNIDCFVEVRWLCAFK